MSVTRWSTSVQSDRVWVDAGDTLAIVILPTGSSTTDAFVEAVSDHYSGHAVTRLAVVIPSPLPAGLPRMADQFEVDLYIHDRHGVRSASTPDRAEPLSKVVDSPPPVLRQDNSVSTVSKGSAVPVLLIILLVVGGLGFWIGRVTDSSDSGNETVTVEAVSSGQFEFEYDGRTLQPVLADTDLVVRSTGCLAEEFNSASDLLAPSGAAVILRVPAGEDLTSTVPVEILDADSRSLAAELVRQGLALPQATADQALRDAADEARRSSVGVFSAEPDCTVPGRLRLAVAYLTAASGAKIPADHPCLPMAVSGTANSAVTATTTTSSSSSIAAPPPGSTASPSDVARLDQLEEWRTEAESIRADLASGIGLAQAAFDPAALVFCSDWLADRADDADRYLALLRTSRDTERDLAEKALVASAVAAALSEAKADSDKALSDAQVNHDAALKVATDQHQSQLDAAVQKATEEANAAAQVRIDEAEQRAATAEASAASRSTSGSGSGTGAGSSSSSGSGSSSSSSSSGSGSSGYTGRRCYAPGGATWRPC